MKKFFLSQEKVTFTYIMRVWKLFWPYVGEFVQWYPSFPVVRRNIQNVFCQMDVLAEFNVIHEILKQNLHVNRAREFSIAYVFYTV